MKRSSFSRWQRLGWILAFFIVMKVFATPQIVRVDGAVYDAAGLPVTGVHSMVVKAYDAASGGTLLWTSNTYGSVVLGAGGKFTVNLDATTGSPNLVRQMAASASSGGVYFEISYDTNTVKPRIRAKGTVFALSAGSLHGVTVSAAEMNYLSGVTANIQSQINTAGGVAGKVSKTGDSMSGALQVGAAITSTGAVTGSGFNSTGATASRFAMFDGSKNVVSSAFTTTDTEFGYLSGVTAVLQTQINAKATLANVIAKAGDTMTGDLGLAGSQATAGRALFLDSSRRIASSAVTSSELAYLSGVTNSLSPIAQALQGVTGTVLGGYLNGLTANVQTQVNNLKPLNVSVVSANTVAAVNTAYLTNSASLVGVTLPTNCVVGDRLKVVGLGTGGWKIVQRASQTIDYAATGDSTGVGSVTTTGIGGYLQSINSKSAVELMCRATDNNWIVTASDGQYTGSYASVTNLYTIAGATTLVVPAHVRRVTVKAWGAGGGGGAGANNGPGGGGGGGAYMTSLVNVSPGDTLTIVVGSGGAGGGIGGTTGTGGGGGAYSAIRLGANTLVLAAGGGGGGGGAKNVVMYGGSGGGGGAPVGIAGGSGGSAGGVGGTAGNPGTGGVGANVAESGGSGGYLSGGDGCPNMDDNQVAGGIPFGGLGGATRNGNSASGGGGGGAGYFGGGGGSASSAATTAAGGGGGGSSVGSSGTAGSSGSSATGGNAGNNSDTDLGGTSTYGKGGNGGAVGAVGAVGNSGAVVISY
ncbi:MAG: hypothetical protein JST16_12255 [Bdellovibrionales bacterium]|nr:hypothetical protein [Bdellovibrionales bacterium]